MKKRIIKSRKFLIFLISIMFIVLGISSVYGFLESGTTPKYVQATFTGVQANQYECGVLNCPPNSNSLWFSPIPSVGEAGLKLQQKPGYPCLWENNRDLAYYGFGAYYSADLGQLWLGRKRAGASCYGVPGDYHDFLFYNPSEPPGTVYFPANVYSRCDGYQGNSGIGQVTPFGDELGVCCPYVCEVAYGGQCCDFNGDTINEGCCSGDTPYCEIERIFNENTDTCLVETDRHVCSECISDQNCADKHGGDTNWTCCAKAGENKCYDSREKSCCGEGECKELFEKGPGKPVCYGCYSPGCQADCVDSDATIGSFIGVPKFSGGGLDFSTKVSNVWNGDEDYTIIPDLESLSSAKELELPTLLNRLWVQAKRPDGVLFQQSLGTDLGILSSDLVLGARVRRNAIEMLASQENNPGFNFALGLGSEWDEDLKKEGSTTEVSYQTIEYWVRGVRRTQTKEIIKHIDHYSKDPDTVNPSYAGVFYTCDVKYKSPFPWDKGISVCNVYGGMNFPLSKCSASSMGSSDPVFHVGVSQAMNKYLNFGLEYVDRDRDELMVMIRLFKTD